MENPSCLWITFSSGELPSVFKKKKKLTLLCHIPLNSVGFEGTLHLSAIGLLRSVDDFTFPEFGAGIFLCEFRTLKMAGLAVYCTLICMKTEIVLSNNVWISIFPESEML